MELADSEVGVNLRRAVRNTELTPFLLAGVTIALSIDAVERLDRLSNVVGLIPGTINEYVLIGAHYDHLGLGARKSLVPEHVGEIHNGADDNASGVAGLLKLASELSSERSGCGLLLVAFAAEELGLQGSTAFISQPPVDLRAVRAMINLDMIGRSNGDLLIGGVGTAVEFRPLLESLEAGSGLTFKFAETPQAASDHLPFSGEKIPVLFFFSGLHPDYHTPSDDWDRIDRKRAGQIVSVVKAVAQRLRKPESAVRFVETDSDAALLEGSVGPALLGLITAYSWEGDGILVASVKPGSVAAGAGFEAGDIIVGCDGQVVFNRLDLIAALTENQAFQGGPHIIAVLRQDRLIELGLGAD
jgi:hypothetical protein